MSLKAPNVCIIIESSDVEIEVSGEETLQVNSSDRHIYKPVDKTLCELLLSPVSMAVCDESDAIICSCDALASVEELTDRVKGRIDSRCFASRRRIHAMSA